MAVTFHFETTVTRDGVEKKYGEGTCLSTDEKPIEGIANGCRLVEMDTSKIYHFDEENEVWLAWGGGSNA